MKPTTYINWDGLKDIPFFYCDTNEGQPISILEAMGNAMAIITTNHAGIPDIATNKEHGLVIDKNNINLEEIYNYILRLDKERSSLRNICERNYNIAHSNYTEQPSHNNSNRHLHIPDVPFLYSLHQTQRTPV